MVKGRCFPVRPHQAKNKNVMETEAYKIGWNACNTGRLFISNDFACNRDIQKYEDWKRGWKECQDLWNNGEIHLTPKNYREIGFKNFS